MSRAAVVEGLGAMVPPREVCNDEIAALVGSDDEWIRMRTGIGQRHWASPGTTTGDLAAVAGQRALESAGGDTVDLLILATSTPNQPMPATAPEVASKLGLGNVPGYDLSAACAGFIYALASAAGAIAAGIAERTLVIGADIWSTRLNPADRATAIIFGDGAGAMVLRAGGANELGAVAGFDLGSDGTNRELAVLMAGGSRQRSLSMPPRKEDDYLSMRGKEIFAHAVRRMADSSQALATNLKWSIDDVDWFVGHQANSRILHAVAGLLGIDRSHVLIHLDRVGNTSAASIPLALADGVSKGCVRSGHKVLITSFGGGLSWGSTGLQWPELSVSPICDNT
jgi:3-oxoacyl-[acyl-carrier-protein] synthase III